MAYNTTQAAANQQISFLSWFVNGANTCPVLTATAIDPVLGIISNWKLCSSERMEPPSIIYVFEYAVWGILLIVAVITVDEVNRRALLRTRRERVEDTEMTTLNEERDAAVGGETPRPVIPHNTSVYFYTAKETTSPGHQATSMPAVLAFDAVVASKHTAARSHIDQQLIWIVLGVIGIIVLEILAVLAYLRLHNVRSKARLERLRERGVVIVNGPTLIWTDNIPPQPTFSTFDLQKFSQASRGRVIQYVVTAATRL